MPVPFVLSPRKVSPQSGQYRGNIWEEVMCKHVHESQRLLFREAVTHSLLGLLFIPDTQSMGVSQPTLKSSSLKNLLKKQVSQEFGAKQFKI